MLKEKINPNIDYNVASSIFPELYHETFKKVKFPMAQHTNVMPVEDFLSIAAMPVNRDVIPRLRKAVTRFVEPMIGHAEVAVIHYTGPTVSTPAWFQQGHYYCIDGNTRAEIWRRYLRGETIGAVPQLKVPEYVDVKVYEFEDAYAAVSAYYTFDSTDAVETKGDKVTGALRASNLLDRVKNHKLKKGQVGGALDIGCPWKGRAIFQVPNINDLLDQVEAVKEQLTAMDKLDIFGKGHFHVQAPIGIALAAGVLMGEDNIRWLEALEILSNYDFKLEYPADKDMHPALYQLILGNRENTIGIHNALPYDIGHGQAPAVVHNYIAYCWLAYINDDDDFVPPNKTNISNKYLELLNMAWNKSE